MKTSGKVKYSPVNFVAVKLSDMLDFCLALIEYDVDFTLLDFYLDLFPKGVKKSDIENYFESFSFVSEKQVLELREKSDLIIELLNDR